MDFTDGASWLLIPLQILVVDLLLGADNALVIALACRSLDPRDMRRAATIGIAGAILIRLAMTMAATWLLAIPLVKLIGAAALIMIAMNIREGEEFDAPEQVGRRAGRNLWAVAGVIIVADAAMGLDNVVALAAIARGNFWLLAIGVALSLPVLGYGGVLLTRILQKAPGLVTFGAAMLGWIAGGMAISDPVIASWAETNAPALVAIAPLLGAAFIYFYGGEPSRERKEKIAPPRRRDTLPTAPRLPEAPPTAAAPAVLERFGDRTPEPEARVEAPRVPGSRDDRLAIIGVLILAVAAGVIIMVASYMDSLR